MARNEIVKNVSRRYLRIGMQGLTSPVRVARRHLRIGMQGLTSPVRVARCMNRLV
ncbi:hypothetical protein HanHA89_Chr05g0202141 [Helianthus annuus]|nr:hypothetical protein HanHA89_Chr05g0202141 [Helianthus annuus]